MPSVIWRVVKVLMFIAWMLALNIIPIALPIDVDVIDRKSRCGNRKIMMNLYKIKLVAISGKSLSEFEESVNKFEISIITERNCRFYRILLC